MEKLQIGQIFDCNRVIYKLIEQQTNFPIYVGIKLYSIYKKFDEIEEYVFKVMEMTFENFDFNIMTEEQKIFFNKLLREEVELDFEKITIDCFENNDNVKLSIDEIDKLMIILK